LEASEIKQREMSAISNYLFIHSVKHPKPALRSFGGRKEESMELGRRPDTRTRLSGRTVEYQQLAGWPGMALIDTV
jgi:hypothetical protein